MTMYDSIFEQNAWCYWVVSIAAMLSFVGFIVACICSCRHSENKSEYLGLAGMVTITRSENHGFDGQPPPDIAQIVTQDAVDGGKRTSTANRSLPDIPKDRNGGRDEKDIASTPQDMIYEAAEAMGDPSELYATVQDKDPKRDTDTRETRPNSLESSLLQEDDSVYPYARLNSSKSPNDEHPYAQVHSIQKNELIRQDSSCDSNQIADVNQACTSSSQPTNPIAPPRTRRSSSHNSLLNVEVSSSDIHAANAISGSVQANQDLPYMTPPLLMSLPRLPQLQHNCPPQQHFSGDSQDSKGYTSISVREPLANIIAQTKAANQSRQTPHRSLTDSHYATVSDDSDEMYAAIDEQEKIYTSGSETYAQIQPMTSEQNRVTVSEQIILHQVPSRITNEESIAFPAPQPPSVDSLRYAAHAHSRQASSSSATSSIVNPGSPKPEKRQANSPLPPPPPPLPPTDEHTDVYALIEKHGISEDPQPQGHRQHLTPGRSLEDMYAKVMKKKRESEEESHVVNTGNISMAESKIPMNKLMEMSRASWSSHDSVEIQKREPEIYRSANILPDILSLDSSTEFSKVARIYELDRITPDHVFEPSMNTQRITNSTDGCNDPDYEMLRPFSRGDSRQNLTHPSTNIRNGIDVLPFYSVPFKHRQISNASSEDPGYEKVRLRRRVELDVDVDSEPNYESMPHESGEPNYASVCRPGYNDTDPNYESVHNCDPNYESVRYMSLSQKPSTEPPYEQVNSYKSDRSIDGYEKVRCEQKEESNYEKIHISHGDLVENADTDDEQYVQV